ncbi:hypothetical protein AAF712_011184 [Marasmius tenuissimus]|uniref:Uncharacterized protein n=1 Tax=Marasmius tenuissimus TaxID=585030 RepID=A0ABR2ZM25_9AGAR
MTNIVLQDPLWRRFTKAYNWFCRLKESTDVAVDNILTECRQRLVEVYKEVGLVEDQETPGVSSVEDKLLMDNDENWEEEDGVKRAREAPTPLSQPSEYLHSRCPLCFGGSSPDHSGEFKYDSIVCLDACFTQKHNSSSRDPRKEYPDSHVESVRPSKEKSKPKSAEGDVDEEDGYEGNLKVPNSALNGCQTSFKAADERRTKSSTKYFDCTGVMAMLCRHDRVLWLANMNTAGKKQFTVFALINKLYRHLPLWWRIALLYNIGCQTDRSCQKWGFLSGFLDRLGFAISVFHTFGHCWACQLIYHPRKCEGFGFSDGEGCERFWHAISRLIPHLRVCGYHQRLYTLDIQIAHNSEANLPKLGAWIVGKSSSTVGRLHEGEQAVLKSGKSEEFLREQWRLQVDKQTAPLKRHSKGQGKQAVEEVICLRTSVEVLTSELSEYRKILSNVDAPLFQVAMAQEKVGDTKTRLSSAERSLKIKERALGVTGEQRIQHLWNSVFLEKRMNARAIKTRLVAKLRARKFERDRLERTFWSQLNGKQKFIAA